MAPMMTMVGVVNDDGKDGHDDDCDDEENGAGK